MNFTICASGNLGNVVLNNLISKHIDISCVFTDSKSDIIIETCANNAIPYYVGNPRKGKAKEWLDENGLKIQHMLSINYLFLLEEDILDVVEGYAVNFHGSLLPKYRGRTPHVWAIINGEKQTGITAHLMNARCDDGDIVKQVVVPIENEDTGAILLLKYNQIYPTLVESVIDMISNDAVEPKKQNSTLATYYGKRTPADGHINWDWQKERIRNWCRAQAQPYPGAFALLKGKRIIINKIENSDLGYNNTITNGTVIGFENDKPVIKVQNGAIVLSDYVADVAISKNDIIQ